MDASDRHIHLINPLENACGGSEWRTFQLFEILCEHSEVSLWTEQKPDKAFLGHYPIRNIEPARGQFPVGGTQVFVGVYFEVGPWVKLAKPRRAIILFNTFYEEGLLALLALLKSAGWPEPEIVYTSDYHRKQSEKYPGIVQLSPINIDLFHVKPVSSIDTFTVGRLSRDFLLKHHRNDPDLYTTLANAGCDIRILGGTCLAEFMQPHDRITLLPQGVEQAGSFLQQLDCFFYRTSIHVTETWGRVVAEAMACGLPVVAENRGGFVDLIRHGENGFLFETDDEAYESIMRLKKDPELRLRVGQAARQTVEDLLSPDSLQKVADFYQR